MPNNDMEEDDDSNNSQKEEDLSELLAEIEQLAEDDEDFDESEFDDLPPMPFEGVDIEKALKQAQKDAKGNEKELLEEFRKRFPEPREFSLEAVFENADKGENSDPKELAKLFALLMALPMQAQNRDCDCSRELAALQRAQAALRRAQANLRLAQNNLTAARAARRRAQAVERRAWRAYRAAQRLVARVCGGLGRFDPLCLVAITYETFLGNKWRIRAGQLRAAQQAELNAIRLVRIARQDLARAQQRFNQALQAYFWCLIRCLFGF